MAQEGTGTGTPSMAEMMRLLLEDRRKREEEIAEEKRRREEDLQRREEELAAERRRHEEERAAEWQRREEERGQEHQRWMEEEARRAKEADQRVKEVQEQMEMMRKLVEESEHQAKPKTGAATSDTAPKLTKLTDGDDIEAYLVTFERMMIAYEVEERRWAYKLAPQLTGRAQQAYAAMEAKHAGDYEKLKEVILRRYDITEESYRQRFRKATRRAGETPREVATRLHDLAQKWMRGCTTVEELLDRVVMEQFLETLPTEVRIWVRERTPKTSGEAGQLAEDYEQARKTSREGSRPDHGRRTQESSRPEHGRRQERGPSAGDPRRCLRCGQTGHWARECPRGMRPGNRVQATGREQPRGEVRCFNCGRAGHVATRCPNDALFCGVEENQSKGVYRSGVVERQYVKDILLDTGCTRTLVRRGLVPRENMQDGEVVTIRCAHGDMALYPVANVEMEVGGRLIKVKAAVSNTLPMSVLLGRDVPELMDLLENKGDALAVMTRAQARQQDKEECVRQQREKESGVQPHAVMEETIQGPDEETIQGPDEDQWCNFDEDLFMTGKVKEKLTRKQKREGRRKFQEGQEQNSEGPQQHLGVTGDQLQELQQEDPTLAEVRRAAEGQLSTAGIGFFMRDGLLYRNWKPPGHLGEETSVEQLVLPIQCRKTVLEVAHKIPLAGHLGRDKTSRRILQRFYWPTLYRDVKEFCRSCGSCQKCSPKKPPRAPLIPLPVIEEPFRRVAMDIVGPLPRSRSGNRYILVLCDYATRYPEAIPVRNIDAEHIAEELLKVFSRIGIPEEILTDQGANFTSQLLKEVYNLLGVHSIRTSPYHPQTDGLVERFNQTLKSMLRRSATQEGKDWDKLIPYLLFAYREVPQASTGFSPFELIYGRPVRGPLDILKESWETSNRSDESIVSYVLTMREKLEKMSELVQENLTRAQQQQKRWYDQTAREREFTSGDQVLVLLPTSTSKLLAQWQGPYSVVKRVGKVNYKVDMCDRRKRHRIFHVNMLRKWHIPTTTAYLAEEMSEGKLDDEMPVWGNERDEPQGQPTIGAQLTRGQKEEMRHLLEEFADVMKSKPGRTSLVEHNIETGQAHPIKLPPYRLPHAYRSTVKQELDDMLDSGIIEPSRSEWAAPIVLVPKKDGTLRLCVDYRRLNSVARTDAYPMPRVDDLIDKLGKAKFITTLALTRGYWQVPVAQEARHKTAFTTPFGLFQFTMMPFGLNGAPATFQRMMDELIRGLEDCTAAYLDDLVVFSTSWEEHLEHVRAVLRRLRSAGLTAKPAKCQFGMADCVYLGHVVGSGTVRPELSKVEAVETFPKPETKKQVRAFLGLTGYYRKFIPDYSTIATPLTDLTRKRGPNSIVWSADCETAFGELKKRMCSSPVLRSPNFDRPFVLQTDASNRGVGAVLSQSDESGDEHPVAYFSRKLLDREERYSTVEKECLAIKLGVQAFRVYLLGKRFTIQTDHRSLEWLDRLKENNSRLSRWSLSLQPFQFDVRYRAGKANNNADGLSRAT